MSVLTKVRNYLSDIKYRLRHGGDKYSINLYSRLLVIKKNNRIIKEIELNQLKSVKPRKREGITYEQIELVIELEKVNSRYIIPEETSNFEVLCDYFVSKKYLTKDWYQSLYLDVPQ